MKRRPVNVMTDDDIDQRMYPGHGLDADVLRADLIAEYGPPGVGEVLVTEEVHFRYVPRVKHCSEYDGFGCPLDGDWHAHWTQVRPHPDAAYTLAWWGPTTKEGDR